MKTFSIKIRAVDASGNFGKWSWPLTIKLTNEIELSPQVRHYSSSESLNYQISNDGKKNGKQFSKFFIGFISI